MSELAWRFRCTRCGREYPLGVKRCPCGKGVLRFVLPLQVERPSLPVTEAPGIWRYEAFLPPVSTKVSLQEGKTPMIPSLRLGENLGIFLAYKDETRNPTGSFKDRAAAVMLSVARELGVDSVTTASSGNGAGAISLYAALSGISAYIFMYRPTRQKLIQALSYGAKVFLVETSSEARVLELAEEAAEVFGWSLLNTTAAANPFVTEGYKTISYEIYEQGQGDVPDWIAIPVGSGSLLIGIWQGFCELRKAKLLQTIPRLLGVQPAGSAPIARAFLSGARTIDPVESADTIATALSLEDPGVSGLETLRVVQESNGAMLTISDEELGDTTRMLARQDGIFGEASGVISVAGVIKAVKQQIIKPGENVVCVVTGSGLKDLRIFLEKNAPQAISIQPSIEAVRTALKKRRKHEIS